MFSIFHIAEGHVYFCFVLFYLQTNKKIFFKCITEKHYLAVLIYFFLFSKYFDTKKKRKKKSEKIVCQIK